MFQWDAKFVILVWLVGRSCSQFEIPDKNDPMRLSCRVRTVEWISKDRIAVAYSNGLINLYHSNGTETPALRNTIQTYQVHYEANSYFIFHLLIFLLANNQADNTYGVEREASVISSGIL